MAEPAEGLVPAEEDLVPAVAPMDEALEPGTLVPMPAPMPVPVPEPEPPSAVATFVSNDQVGETTAVVAVAEGGGVLVTGEMAAEMTRKRKAPVTDASDFLPEEAVAKAAEEGLTLVSARSETGYLHVYLSAKGGKAPAATSAGKPPRVYQLQPKKGISHGYFRSAEGAALAHARSLGVEGSREKASKRQNLERPLTHTLLSELSNVTEEAAAAMAVEEGLTLVTSNSSKSGFKHVHIMNTHARPFRLAAQQGITQVEGNFASASAAALAHARQIGPEAAAKEAAAAAMIKKRKPRGEGRKALKAAALLGPDGLPLALTGPSDEVSGVAVPLEAVTALPGPSDEVGVAVPLEAVTVDAMATAAPLELVADHAPAAEALAAEAPPAAAAFEALAAEAPPAAAAFDGDPDEGAAAPEPEAVGTIADADDNL